MKELVTWGLALMLLSAQVSANRDLTQMLINDVSFLASDKLAGRANFSEGIATAGHYIEQRFRQIGLEPLAGHSSLLQQVPVYQYQVNTVTVRLNNSVIAPDDVAVASTLAGTTNLLLEDFTISEVTKTQNVKSVVSALNEQGGKHLVMIHPSHHKWFELYRNYFARGITTDQKRAEGVLILVLAKRLELTDVAVTLNTQLDTQPIYNVVGKIPGHSSQELVVYSAHYDHLGVGDGLGDQIYNGADDNASGTAAMINLATRFKRQGKPQRTLIFAAFAGEEIGGFGSQFFAKQVQPEQITAMVNLEMVGKPSKFGPGSLWMTGAERSNLLALINHKLKIFDAEVHPDPYPEQKLFYRSDNASLAKYGVPAHTFSTTQLDKDSHYHQPSDEVSTLDLTSMYAVVDMIFNFAQFINSGEITPSRIEPLATNQMGKIY